MVIAQWLQPIMMHMLQHLSTASRLLEGTESKVEISSSVQSLLTLLEGSDFALGKGIALMFAKAMKSSVHAPSSEIYRMGDPCNQVHFVVAGKVAKMMTDGSRNSRVHVTAAAEAHGLADVVEADACLGIDALWVARFILCIFVTPWHVRRGHPAQQKRGGSQRLHRGVGVPQAAHTSRPSSVNP